VMVGVQPAVVGGTEGGKGAAFDHEVLRVAKQRWTDCRQSRSIRE
jgi:hypothetical protein